MDELDANFDSSGETHLEKQFKSIVKWQPSEYLTACALQPINDGKNRSNSFIPCKLTTLSCQPKAQTMVMCTADTGSDIN